MSDRVAPPHFHGWTRERFGPVLGLSIQQAALLSLLAALPLLAMSRGHWWTALGSAAACVPLAALVLIPIRGRPAYRWLVAHGIRPDHIATSGDSEGGNLAISVALKLRDDGAALPAALVAMSPWLDMEGKGETLDSNSATDALVQRGILEAMSGMFLGPTGSAIDPLANPLYSDPTGLPPTYLTAGGAETLLDNAQRFAESARSAGADVTVDIVDDMQHVFTFLAGRADEADRTIASIAEWLRPKLGLS